MRLIILVVLVIRFFLLVIYFEKSFYFYSYLDLDRFTKFKFGRDLEVIKFWFFIVYLKIIINTGLLGIVLFVIKEIYF